jgi:hypothetical protein
LLAGAAVFQTSRNALSWRASAIWSKIVAIG